MLALLSANISATSEIPSTDYSNQQSIQTVLTNDRLNILKNKNLTDVHELLQQLYPSSNTTLLWFDQNKPTTAALALLQELTHADKYGLHSNDYDGERLITLLTELEKSPESQAKDQQIQFDIALSASALRFIKHLHYGRIDPKQAAFNLPERHNDELDLVATLVQLSKSNQIVEDIQQVEPQFSHYQLLKTALHRYQKLAEYPELTQLPKPQQSAIKLGDRYSGIPVLRRLLIAEQDLPLDAITSDTEQTLDETLINALKNYQTRHGLTADGILGWQTFKQLTTPFSNRIQQIELTLERWRWLPPPQSPMIMVNIPQFKLFAFKSNEDHEADLLRMEVIVGQVYEHTQTPVFFSEMHYLVLRPYWDVPPNITQRELLPQIKRNPNYLNEHHLELVKGQTDNSPVVPATPKNIHQLALGKLRLRQLPGADNALGNIKFMMPNKYNVYLHSTPTQQFFTESHRAFSHGCIRVSNPLALAEYVLSYATEPWSSEKIIAAMQGEPNQRIDLNTPIPVMMVYGTVMPLESGVVQFFEDIYGHDAKLAALLKYSTTKMH
jgi:hypothetical protein